MSTVTDGSTTDVSAPEAVDRLGLPFEPTARVNEILRRRNATAAEAEQAREQAQRASRLRDVLIELTELGWKLTPPLPD